MADTVGGRLGVKASGGIRTAEYAVAMLDAGATRLGLSGPAPCSTGWAELPGSSSRHALCIVAGRPDGSTQLEVGQALVLATTTGRDGGVGAGERRLDTAVGDLDAVGVQIPSG